VDNAPRDAGVSGSGSTAEPAAAEHCAVIQLMLRGAPDRIQTCDARFRNSMGDVRSRSLPFAKVRLSWTFASLTFANICRNSPTFVEVRYHGVTTRRSTEDPRPA